MNDLARPELILEDGNYELGGDETCLIWRRVILRGVRSCCDTISLILHYDICLVAGNLAERCP